MRRRRGPLKWMLQIPQALAAAETSQHGHRLQIPGQEANAPPHPGVRDPIEVADQVEMGYG